MGNQLAVDLAFAYASGDEQAVLRAEVNDNDGFTLSAGQNLAGRRRLLTPQFLGNPR